jgi:hypothetical protein
MPHLLFLGLEVIFRMAARSYFTRNPFNHLNSAPLQRRNLVGIIRQQSHLRHSKSLEDSRRQCERAKPLTTSALTPEYRRVDDQGVYQARSAGGSDRLARSGLPTGATLTGN